MSQRLTKQVPLPSQQDFEAFEGCWDQNEAWQTFGGLTVDEAFLKFRTRPELHAEHFAWMGTIAFEFYLPVLDRYLRACLPSDFSPDGEAALLGDLVYDRITQNKVSFSKPTYLLLKALAETVLTRVPELATTPRHQKRIRKKWHKVLKRSPPFEGGAKPRPRGDTPDGDSAGCSSGMIPPRLESEC